MWGGKLGDNPFPGPQPYRAADRDRFYGREAVASELTNMILAHRSVAVFGPSGAGKSSLMQAAVLPELDEEYDFRVAAVDAWPAGEAPVGWLLEVLYKNLKLTPPGEPLGVIESVDSVVEQAFQRSERPVLIVLDQIEQLLFTQRDPAEVTHVFDWLDCFASKPLRGLHLVLALREDYLGRFRDRARGRHRLLEHNFRLGPMTVGEITGAVIAAAADAEPPQEWSHEATRNLMLQVREPDQSERDEAEVQTAFAQIVCRALFSHRVATGIVDDGAVEAEPILQNYLAGALADLGELRGPAEQLLEEHLIADDGTRTLLTEEAARASGVAEDGDLDTILTDLESAAILRAERHRSTRYFELGHDWLAKKVFDRKRERISRVEEEARERAAQEALESARAEARRARVVVSIVTVFGLLAAGLGVTAWLQREAAIDAQSESDRRQTKAEEATEVAEQAQVDAETARTQSEQARTRAEKSDKENERSVRQMFEVSLRPLTDYLVAQQESAGVVVVDERWTPLMERDNKTVVAASLGESFRAVVAGHEAVLSETGQGRSLFLEITIPWLLADQARRTIAIVPRESPTSKTSRRLEKLKRSLLRLSFEVEIVESLLDAEAMTDVGVIILDDHYTAFQTGLLLDRSDILFPTDEVAELNRLLQSGVGVLAIGRGRTWLERPPSEEEAAPTLENYPMNTALASLGVSWSDAEVTAEELAKRDVPAIVRFENAFGASVNLFTSNGERTEYYTTLATDEARELRTTVGRRWVFRAVAEERELGALVIEDADQTVRIGAVVAKTKNKVKRPAKHTTPEVEQQPESKTVKLPEKLSSEELNAGRNEAKRIAKECGTKLETLMSEIAVKVTVAGDGTVKKVVVLPPAKGTAEAVCVVKRVSKLTFPRSRKGGEATWKLRLY